MSYLSTTGQHHDHHPSTSLSSGGRSDSLPSSNNTEEMDSMEEENHMVRIHTSSVVSQLDYVTVCVRADTTVRDVITAVLERIRTKYKDDILFYLSLQLTDTNPSQEGLTRKTLILEDTSRMVEYVNCQEWFHTMFILRMKAGMEVKVFISILMEDQDWIILTLSEDSTVKQVISMILNLYR